MRSRHGIEDSFRAATRKANQSVPQGCGALGSRRAFLVRWIDLDPGYRHPESDSDRGVSCFMVG
jgi:hypothetical protein